MQYTDLEVFAEKVEIDTLYMISSKIFLRIIVFWVLIESLAENTKIHSKLPELCHILHTFERSTFGGVRHAARRPRELL